MTELTPFKKLLVANRGEIAVRVMRTAKAMGYGTVAVYSEPDAQAEHVRLADQAVCIGQAAPADSYLRIDAIIAAAKATGADAIHPGYGFLAENEALPKACEEAGIIFVGPGADAIRDMGDKAGAKALMMDAGVPCVPGYQGEDQSPEKLFAEAVRIGFPVMIKATAGGGGRGMRLVEAEGDFLDHLQSAKSEAKTAFGNDIVLLEKAIINPRHVEIQIMADRYGNAVHCGERDCSVQRRHQKVIEEAPSPAVDDALRARMGQASVDAVKSIGYVGAGTFEFLLDADGNFYFMEMNTRLQVEHPVTEMITGLDLVELQLRVAAGEALPLTQEDISLRGHSIEVRLCAEDPVAGFMPQSGNFAIWEPADFVRVEHGLRSGSDIPPYYDSMVAKLIATGPSREDARRKLLAALDQTVAIGVRTNKDFLGDCLAHPTFVAGQATTAFVAENEDELMGAGTRAERRTAMIAAAIMCADPGNRLVHGYPTPVRLARGEAEYVCRVQVFQEGVCRVEAEGSEGIDLTVVEISGNSVSLEVNGVRETAVFWSDRETVNLQFESRCYDFADLTYHPTITAVGEGGDGKVRASMNGNVVSVDVAVGDTVQPGQKLIVVEAMKMEHTHSANVAGTVSAVNVQTGMQVSTHAILVEIETE